jgi:hypothetical protein
LSALKDAPSILAPLAPVTHRAVVPRQGSVVQRLPTAAPEAGDLDRLEVQHHITTESQRPAPTAPPAPFRDDVNFSAVLQMLEVDQPMTTAWSSPTGNWTLDGRGTVMTPDAPFTCQVTSQDATALTVYFPPGRLGFS